MYNVASHWEGVPGNLVTPLAPQDGVAVTFVPNALSRSIEWVQVRERGAVGLVPAADPEPIHVFNATLPAVTLNGKLTLQSSGVMRPAACITSLTTDTQTTVHTVAAGLNSGQVSRLIRITRDWSKQAELVSSSPAAYRVQNGAVLLDKAAKPSFATAYTSFLLTAHHRLAPSGVNGEHAWFRAWRQRAARAFLMGATADALVQALLHQLAELRSSVASARASAPSRLSTQLVRLAHFIVPNAPPALLQTQVSC